MRIWHHSVPRWWRRMTGVHEVGMNCGLLLGLGLLRLLGWLRRLLVGLGDEEGFPLW